MIKPQSTTLVYAYDPECLIVRCIYLNADNIGYVMPHEPDLSTLEWYHLLTFDHEHYEVQVVCRGFLSVRAARKALEFILWMSKKDFRIGGITDMVSEEDYLSVLNPALVIGRNEFPE